MKTRTSTIKNEISLSLSFESKSIQLIIDSLDLAVNLKLASDEILTYQATQPENLFNPRAINTL